MNVPSILYFDLLYSTAGSLDYNGQKEISANVSILILCFISHVMCLWTQRAETCDSFQQYFLHIYKYIYIFEKAESFGYVPDKYSA